MEGTRLTKKPPEARRCRPNQRAGQNTHNTQADCAALPLSGGVSPGGENQLERRAPPPPRKQARLNSQECPVRARHQRRSRETTSGHGIGRGVPSSEDSPLLGRGFPGSVRPATCATWRKKEEARIGSCMHGQGPGSEWSREVRFDQRGSPICDQDLRPVM